MTRENLSVTSPSDVTRLLVPIMERIARLAAGRVISGGGPRPAKGPYCTVDWVHIRPLQQNHGQYKSGPDGKDQPMTQLLRNECAGALRIAFYGEAAMDAAVMAWGWLDNDNRTFDLWKEPLGYGGVGPIHADLAVFGATGQPRAFFELALNLAFEAEYPVDWFDLSQWALLEHSGNSEVPRKETPVYPEKEEPGKEPGEESGKEPGPAPDPGRG